MYTIGKRRAGMDPVITYSSCGGRTICRAHSCACARECHPVHRTAACLRQSRRQQWDPWLQVLHVWEGSHPLHASLMQCDPQHWVLCCLFVCRSSVFLNSILMVVYKHFCNLSTTEMLSYFPSLLVTGCSLSLAMSVSAWTSKSEGFHTDQQFQISKYQTVIQEQDQIALSLLLKGVWN
jgi:hypothetical protein